MRCSKFELCCSLETPSITYPFKIFAHSVGSLNLYLKFFNTQKTLRTCYTLPREIISHEIVRASGPKTRRTFGAILQNRSRTQRRPALPVAKAYAAIGEADFQLTHAARLRFAHHSPAFDHPETLGDLKPPDDLGH